MKLPPAIALTLILGFPMFASGQATRSDESSVRTTVYAPQNRPDVRGTSGAVSAGHPLAAQVGLRVLQDGGTATDAVIAMAGVLAVVRPHMNGVGGDAFAIFLRRGDRGYRRAQWKRALGSARDTRLLP